MKPIKNKNLVKNIVAIIVVFCIIAGMSAGFAYYFIDYRNDMNSQLEKAIEEKDTAIALFETAINEFEVTIAALETELFNVKSELQGTNAQLRAYAAEIEEKTDEIEQQAADIENYKKIIEDEEAKWRRRYEEYPVATEVWIAMKNLGWSDVVCAGIMGNLMAETGGTGTLDLNWKSNGSSGYGLVQWIGGRRSAIKSKYGTYPSVKQQVQFIHDELSGTNGVRRQVTDKQFNAIMNAKTPEDCAYAFACYYERCATEYRSMRKGFARKAYEYFIY